MRHFGITPEIFEKPPPTIDQGIHWWRRRLHLPEEHEGLAHPPGGAGDRGSCARVGTAPTLQLQMPMGKNNHKFIRIEEKD